MTKLLSPEPDVTRKQGTPSAPGIAPWESLISPWEPMVGTSLLGRSFDRMLDDLWGRRRWMEGNGRLMAPLLDVSEDDENLWISTELPGLKKDQVKVLTKDGVLTISGEKTQTQEERGRTYRCTERHYGNFARSLTLPSSVDPDDIEARFEDGVLKLRIPKREEAKPRAIDIK